MAPTYTAVAADATYSNTEIYYFQNASGVYYAASGINAGNFANYKANLFTETTTATPGVYAIKVIRVGNPT